MSAIGRRVGRLEDRFRAAVEATRKMDAPAGPPAREVLAARLASMGVERGPNESLAETTARAMGIDVQELRCELMRQARGLGSAMPAHHGGLGTR